MATGTFNTPNSVRALRRYWKKNRADLPDARQLAEEIFAETDRLAVILSATLLDDFLTARLAMIFGVSIDSPESERIFRFEGPLGSFSARIEISCLFRIFDDVTCDQLNWIREMRNACAHTKKPISFETSELLSVAKRLFYPNGVIKPANDTQSEIKRAFHFEVLALLNIVIRGYKGEERLAFLKDFGQSFSGALVPLRDK